MTKALAGRHAVITGGGGGIGAATAIALASRGATLTLLGRDRVRLERAADAAGGANVGIVDVADPASVGGAFSAARERAGPVDVLVNVAGVAKSAPFARASVEDWQRTIAIDLTGVFLCCREAVADMLATSHGRIVNVASTAGLRGYRYVAAYCAAKHGVVGLTRALALELAPKGITVNAVCPGFTQTHMLDDTIAAIVGATGRSAEDARAALLRDIPRGAFVRPVDVAEAIAWLCLPNGDAITGQTLGVDGGELAG